MILFVFTVKGKISNEEQRAVCCALLSPDADYSADPAELISDYIKEVKKKRL